MENIQLINQDLINREYYIIHDLEEGDSILYYDPELNGIFEGLTDYRRIDLTKDKLEPYKVSIEDYNAMLEKEIFNSPFIFKSSSKNSLLDTSLDTSLDTTLCPINREPSISDNFNLKHIDNYIKTNFSYFDISIPIIEISNNTYVNKYLENTNKVISIQDAINNYLTDEDIDIKTRIQFDRFIKIYYFYRSYIDLYHDILKYGDIYCKYIYEQFLDSSFFKEVTEYTKEELEKEKSEFISKINMINKQIKTTGNEINQNKCKELLESLVDTFIEKLHNIGINWIPKKKEEAHIISVDFKNKCELESLVRILESDGIDNFYIESANSSIGTSLVSNKMKLTDIEIGNWNAGSGFKKGAIKYYLEQEQEKEQKGGATKRKRQQAFSNDIQLKPVKKARISNDIIKIFINNSEVDLFNIFNIKVSKDNKNIINTFKDKYIEISGPEKLSINSILKALGYPPIRSTKTDEDKDIKNLSIKINDTVSTNIKLSPYNAMLVSLKTWTDLIQIISISLSKSILIKDQSISKFYKTAIIISDRLCETTARMYGLGHVLLNQSHIITYYNYDINSRTLSKETIIDKLNMYNTIQQNKDSIIRYLNEWFNDKITFLENIINNTTDSNLYFILSSLKLSYINKKSKFENNLEMYEVPVDDLGIEQLKQVPNSIITLCENITETALLMGEYQELVENFSTALSGLGYLSVRGGYTLVENFLDTYNSIKQIIVNTYTGTPLPTTATHISDNSDKIVNVYTSSCIAYKFITSGRKPDVYEITFKNIIENIIKNDKHIQCNDIYKLHLESLLKELHTIDNLYQLSIILLNIINYIEDNISDSIAFNYLQQTYNVILAFISGIEYIRDNNIKYSYKIIFKKYLEYSFNITSKMLTNFEIVMDDSEYKCEIPVNIYRKNTYKTKRFSTTRRIKGGSIKRGSIKKKNKRIKNTNNTKKN